MQDNHATFMLCSPAFLNTYIDAEMIGHFHTSHQRFHRRIAIVKFDVLNRLSSNILYGS